MTVLFSNPSIMEAKDRRIKELEDEVEFLQESENGMLQSIDTLEAELAAKDALLREVIEEIDGMYERDIAGCLPLALFHLQEKLKAKLEESK
jgi:hypothetical protein